MHRKRQVSKAHVRLKITEDDQDGKKVLQGFIIVTAYCDLTTGHRDGEGRLFRLVVQLHGIVVAPLSLVLCNALEGVTEQFVALAVIGDQCDMIPGYGKVKCHVVPGDAHL